jgi:hypothetical protein
MAIRAVDRVTHQTLTGYGVECDVMPATMSESQDDGKPVMIDFKFQLTTKYRGPIWLSGI